MLKELFQFLVFMEHPQLCRASRWTSAGGNRRLIRQRSSRVGLRSIRGGLGFAELKAIGLHEFHSVRFSKEQSISTSPCQLPTRQVVIASRVVLAGSKKRWEGNAAALGNGDQFLQAVQDSNDRPHLLSGDFVSNFSVLTAHRKCAMLECQVDKRVAHLSVIQDVLALLTARHLVQRRLGDVDAPAPHQFRHLPEEEGE